MYCSTAFWKNIDLTWKISTILTIIVIAIVTAHIYISKSVSVSDYLCNIATECIGIIVTVIFVDKLFNKYAKFKAKREEFEKIVRMHNLAFFYVKQYMYHLHSIITPMDKKFQDDIQLETPFSLQDLQYLYTPTMLLTESFQQTSIEHFFKYEQEVKKAFTNMLNTINFEFYPDLSEPIQNFIQVSTRFNARTVILDNFKNFSELIVDMLRTDDVYKMYKEYKNSKLKSNIIIPYFMLYDMLKEEQKILLSYISEMGKINTDS